MEIKKALEIYNKQFNNKIIKYGICDEGIVLIADTDDFNEISEYYLVKNSGDIIITNPLRVNITKIHNL